MNEEGIATAPAGFAELFAEAVPWVLGNTRVIDLPHRGAAMVAGERALLLDSEEGQRLTDLVTQLLPFAGPNDFRTDG